LVYLYSTIKMMHGPINISYTEFYDLTLIFFSFRRWQTWTELRQAILRGAGTLLTDLSRCDVWDCVTELDYV